MFLSSSSPSPCEARRPGRGQAGSALTLWGRPQSRRANDLRCCFSSLSPGHKVHKVSILVWLQTVRPWDLISVQKIFEVRLLLCQSLPQSVHIQYFKPKSWFQTVFPAAVHFQPPACFLNSDHDVHSVDNGDQHKQFSDADLEHITWLFYDQGPYLLHTIICSQKCL